MWKTKRFIFVAILTVVVLSGGVVGVSCSSSEDVAEEPPDTAQEANPPEGMTPGPGLSGDLLAKVAEELGIAQQEVEDAFTQAQEEMGDSMTWDGPPSEGMPSDGTPPGDMPAEGMPSEGTPPEGMPSEGTPPEGMPSEGTPPGDMPAEGMSPGMGLSDELLARVAEILGIDQQELADALAEAQGEMPEGSDFPNPEQR